MFDFKKSLIENVRDLLCIPSEEYSYDPLVAVLPIEKKYIFDHKYDHLKADCVVYKGDFIEEEVISRCFDFSDEVRSDSGYTSGLGPYIFEYYKDCIIQDIQNTYKITKKD